MEANVAGLPREWKEPLQDSHRSVAVFEFWCTDKNVQISASAIQFHKMQKRVHTAIQFTIIKISKSTQCTRDTQSREVTEMGT